MRAERKSSLIMLILLGVLVFIYTLGVGVYHSHRLDPLPTFEFLYQAGFLCGVIWWLRADAGKSAVKPVYCSGLLVSIGWFIIIPYHLLKSRGAKGLFPLLGLIGSFVVAQIIALVLYISSLTLDPP